MKHPLTCCELQLISADVEGGKGYNFVQMHKPEDIPKVTRLRKTINHSLYVEASNSDASSTPELALDDDDGQTLPTAEDYGESGDQKGMQKGLQKGFQKGSGSGSVAQKGIQKGIHKGAHGGHQQKADIKGDPPPLAKVFANIQKDIQKTSGAGGGYQKGAQKGTHIGYS